jgi:hypothetical protein
MSYFQIIPVLYPNVEFLNSPNIFRIMNLLLAVSSDTFFFGRGLKIKIPLVWVWMGEWVCVRACSLLACATVIALPIIQKNNI